MEAGTAMTQAQTFPRGTCRYCGCEDADGCVILTVDGYTTCRWVDQAETVCSMPLCQRAAIEDGVIPAPGNRLVMAS